MNLFESETYVDLYAKSAHFEPTGGSFLAAGAEPTNPPVEVEEVVVVGHPSYYTFHFEGTGVQMPDSRTYTSNHIGTTSEYSLFPQSATEAELIKDAINAKVAKELPADSSTYEYEWFVYKDPTTGQLDYTVPFTSHETNTVTGTPIVDRAGNPIDPSNILSDAHNHPGNVTVFHGELSNGDAARLAYFVGQLTPGSAEYNQFSSYVYVSGTGQAYEYKAGDTAGYNGVPLNMGLSTLPIW